MLKKWLPLALKVVVSVALIWFLLGRIDLGAALDRVGRASPSLLAASLALFFLQIVLAAQRWRVVLDAIGAPVPLSAAVRIMYAGIFFNQTLPSSVGGDAVRIYLVHKEGLSVGAAVTGVFLERVATVIALVVLVVGIQPLFQERVPPETGRWVLGVLGVLSVGAVAGLGFLMVLDRLPMAWRRWKLVRGFVLLAADTRRLWLSRRFAAETLAWSAAGHVNITACLYLIGVSLGTPATFIDCLALFPMVILVTTLPISIAGWGVREGAMVAAFGLVGVPGENAMVMSLTFGLLTMAGSLPGGLLWLVSGGRRRDLASVDMEAAAGAACEK